MIARSTIVGFLMSDEVLILLAERTGETLAEVRAQVRPMLSGEKIRQVNWSKDDERVLRENCATMNVAELGALLGRTTWAVRTRLQDMKLSSKRMPTLRKDRWTEDEDDQLRRYVAEDRTRDEIVALMPTRKKYAIHTRLFKLGLIARHKPYDQYERAKPKQMPEEPEADPRQRMLEAFWASPKTYRAHDTDAMGKALGGYGPIRCDKEDKDDIDE